MTDRRNIRPRLSPGWLLLLGPLLGGLTVAGLYAGRDFLLGRMSPPWDDLLQVPAVLGQGAFVAVVVLLAVEWWYMGRRWRERDGWAERTHRQAVATDHPRPLRDQRRQALDACQRRLARQVNLRWASYALLALAPAFLGLVLGLRGIRLNGTRALPYTDYFTPMLVGTAEGGFLWLCGSLVRRRALRLLHRWHERAKALESKPAVPAGSPDGPVPAAARELDSTPRPEAGEPRTVQYE